MDNILDNDNMDIAADIAEEKVETAETAEPVETEAVQEEIAAEKVKSARNLRKERTGLVVSNKMDKTAVVAIVERVTHDKYSKILKRTKKYKVHDENNECDVGDKVLIMETRPISKDKHFRLVKILEKVK